MSVRQPVTIAQNFGCHAWNADQSQVALSPNNEEIRIFNTNGSPDEMKAWGKEEHKLTEHGGFVSAIDWHPETDLIVTSGHDRNAYVWKFEDGTWKPTLVILRINRAATNVRWSPNGKKFGVTSGAKCVPICHFEEGNNWWISKMVKKHKSTVLCIAWCPNNKFIVTGSTDFKCRIFSAYIEDIDTAGPDDMIQWENQDSFGTCLAEFDQAKAWVQGVDWSPCGMQISFTGHGSTTHFVDLDANNPKDSAVQTIYSKFLPNLTLDYMTAELIVTCGFDMNPHLYAKSGGEWSFAKKVDDEKATAKAKDVTSQTAARNKFKQMSKHGQQKDNKNDIKTQHKNYIVDVKKINETTFTTCGVDGRIQVWTL